MKFLFSLILAAFLFSGAVNVNAQLLDENFDYPAGDTIGSYGWTAFSGGNTNALKVVSPGLSYTGYVLSGIGNACRMSNNGQDSYKGFTTVTAGTVYASFMIKVDTVKTGDYIGAFLPSTNTSNFAGRIYIKDTVGGFKFGLSKSTDSPVYTSGVYTTGTTYIIVVKYVINAGTADDQMYLFVFNSSLPSTEPAPSVGPITNSAITDGNISRIALRQGNASSSPTLTIDGIRVSTTWEIASPAPSAPVLSSPVNNATGVSLTPTLDWGDVSGAATYSVQVATDVNFTDIVSSGTGLVSSQYIIPSGILAGNTVYYWRANATNGSGTSSYSSIFNFTTSVSAPSAPTLLSPSNGASGVSVTPLLDWSDAAGATGYQVQVATDAAFNNLVKDTSGVSASQLSIASGVLNNSTQYFWRVNASNAGGTSSYSSAFSFTTLVSAPSVPVLVSPANNSFNVTLTPLLDWNDVPGAVSYRVQIATDAGFSSIVKDTAGILSSQYQVSTALNTNSQYYWRVNATNAGGTSAFSSAFNFFTVPPPPSVPVLNSPANNAVNVSVTPTLVWNSVTDGAPVQTYRVQMALDSAFANIIKDTAGLSNTQYAVPAGLLSGNTKYYWRVNATNAGGTSSYSLIFNFTTVPGAPSAPVLVSPSNNAVNVSLTPVFDWNDVSGAASYRLQVATDAAFNNIVKDTSGITVSQLILASGILSNNTQYYWRANASNAGGSSSFSSAFNFTTLPSAPSAPVLNTPADNAVNVSTAAFFDWSDVSGADSYQIKISSDSLFNTLVKDTAGITVSQYQIPGGILSNNTKYFWRVTAVNAAGSSPLQAPFRFTTIIAAPSAPVLTAPADNSVNISTAPLFDWNDVSGAASYQIKISSDSLFSVLLKDTSGISVSQYQIPGGILSNNTKYFWRVTAVNAGGSSPVQTPFRFTTIAAAPSAPVLVSPTNGASGISLTAALDWNDVPGASTYRVVIALDTSFTSPVKDTSGVAVSQLTLAAGILNPSTKYYWKVNASNAGGTGVFSSVFNFTTVAALSRVNFTSVTLPQYMGSGNATRLPVVFRATVTGLSANTIYRYHTGAALFTDLGTTGFGAGNPLMVNLTTGNFTYTSNAGVSVAGGYETFTTNASGSFTGWFGFVNTGNARFTAGNYLSPSIVIGDTSGNTLYRYALNDSIKVLQFAATSTSNDGTGIYGISSAAPKNIVSLYDNVSGTGKPLAVAFAENIGVTIASTVGYYNTNVAGQNGRWGTIVPNVNANGVKRIEQRSLADASLIGVNADNDGIWRSGANTVNPTGGTTAIVITNSDAPLNALTPSAPVLSAPSNGAVDIALTPLLDWSDIDGASDYQLQISTNAAFTAIIKDTSGILSSQYQVSTALNANTQYFWRVKSSNPVGSSAFSSAFSFTTLLPVPSAPSLIAPANNAVNVSVTPAFDWSDVTLADFMGGKSNSKEEMTDAVVSYRLQVSTDTGFAAVVKDTSGITVSNYTLAGTPLANNTVYYWRVSATNAAGTSAFSGRFTFTAVPLPAAVPVLLLPANNASGVSLTPLFDWQDAANASSYRIQISADSNFAPNIKDTSGILTSQYQIPGGLLAINTKYYWRVQSINAAGSSSFSGKFTFTTSPPPPAQVTFNVIPGGLYNTATGRLNMRDTIKVILVDSANCMKVDSAKGVVDSVNFSTTLNFANAPTGKYYMFVYHRNHIAIATRLTQDVVRGSLVSYNFTTDSLKAFGSNMVKVSTSPVRWAMIPGDANRDGFVDGLDQTVWILQNGFDGYLAGDFNGDGFVDGLDQTAWIFQNGQSYILPCNILDMILVFDPQNPLVPVNNNPANNNLNGSQNSGNQNGKDTNTKQKNGK